MLTDEWHVDELIMTRAGDETRKTHNAWMLKELDSRGIDASRYGMASLQLDGGIAKASEKVHAWFEEQAKSLPEPTRADVAMADLPIAVIGEAHTGGAAMLAAVLSRSFVGPPHTSPIDYIYFSHALYPHRWLYGSIECQE